MERINVKRALEILAEHGHTVKTPTFRKWIRAGWIEGAEKKKGPRRKGQAGQWEFTEEALRAFIREHM